MIERVTPVPERFLPVQVVAILYVGLVLAVSVGVVRHGLPVTTGLFVRVRLEVPVSVGVYVFTLVGAVFLGPFVPLFRRYQPRHCGSASKNGGENGNRTRTDTGDETGPEAAEERFRFQ